MSTQLSSQPTAADFAAKLRANGDDYEQNRVDYDLFGERNRALWAEINGAELAPQVLEALRHNRPAPAASLAGTPEHDRAQLAMIRAEVERVERLANNVKAECTELLAAATSLLAEIEASKTPTAGGVAFTAVVAAASVTRLQAAVERAK